LTAFASRSRPHPLARHLLATTLFVVAIGAAPTLSAAPACTVTLKADGNTAAVQRAMDAPGRRTPVVCLRPGVYGGARLIASRNVTLRRVGKGKAVLDAGSRGRALTITDKDLVVRLEGLVLTNGDIEEGGGVALLGASHLSLVDCWLTGNRASRKGGAIYTQAGQLDLVRSRLSSNYAGKGGGLFAEGMAKVHAAHTMVSDNRNEAGSNGPIWLEDGVRLEFRHSTLAYNVGHGIYLRPSPRGPAPSLLVDSAVIMGAPDAIFVARAKAEKVAVFRSVIHGGIGFIALDLASKRALPRFNLTEQERYRPSKGSPAITLGQCRSKFGNRDLAGVSRKRVCTAGALEAPAADIKATLIERRKKAAKKKKEEPWW